MRLAVIRDGIEDYDYFAMLQEIVDKSNVSKGILADAARLLEVGPDISVSLRKYTKDPETIQKQRSAVAEMIERLAETVEQ